MSQEHLIADAIMKTVVHSYDAVNEMNMNDKYKNSWKVNIPGKRI